MRITFDLQNTELRGVPVSLSLNWDVMPITGVLYRGKRGRHTVRLPTEYCNDKECKSELITEEL
jgi:hypothetical protein